ncbi:MAG: UV-endonuclease-like protein [Candidatus Bipolaricaulis sibiricus]|uniref:UV-endonuclease-like protein n=1 Tax=Bipolaricaulis sibiricus TaxID=2501609 RepID=A0A410FVI5_BIPS1|nr:MAG: UV-endonuclease-like protein [Candidatus Bipolaricaulis sibiricus]
MRIGYPCLNLGLSCRPSRTLRLASLAEERLFATVDGNLRCMEEIVRWNAAHGLLFLRITSDLVPLASHPQNRVPWAEVLAPRFAEIGALIRQSGMRISMHPGQYTLLSSPRPEVTAAARADLAYHAQVLDLLGLDRTAKIQIHGGGVYGARTAAVARFAAAVDALPPAVRERLVVENDERLYTFSDVLGLHAMTGLPVVLDAFHHALNGDGRSLGEALAAQAETWGWEDGLPIVDYSSPLPSGRTGRHAQTLDEGDFARFIEGSRPHDFDLMLEVKDKEQSALRALALAQGDPRLVAEAG